MSPTQKTPSIGQTTKNKLSIGKRPLLFIRVCLALLLAFSLSLCPVFASDDPPRELGLKENTYENAKRTICVVFSPRIADPKSPAVLHTKALGTGFFIRMPGVSNDKKTALEFLITNKHVIGAAKALDFRLNDVTQTTSQFFTVSLTPDGPSRNLFLATDPSIDLAAIYIDTFPVGTDHICFAPNLIIDENKWRPGEVSEGTEVFSTGLLLNYPGLSRNFPVLRFGRIALITDEPWFRGRDANVGEKAFLADLNTTFGTSGSPVMLVPTGIRVNQETGLTETRRTSMFILGVIKGAPTTPAGKVQNTELSVDIPQAVTAIEPPSSLLCLLHEIARDFEKKGFRADAF